MTQPSASAARLPPPEINLDLASQAAWWCGREFNCDCGQTHAVPTQEVRLEVGALAGVPEQLGRVTGRVTIVFDENTFDVAGREVSRLLRKAGWEVVEKALPVGCHADQTTLDEVEPSLAGAAWAVSVGSGTVNDLTKLAAHHRGLPYLTVPTAPSMNGYTSRIGALLVDGVKRTVPAAPPRAVVADLAVLSNAPGQMVASGLADLQSKPCAALDWRLASLLHGEHYCDLPIQLLQHADAQCVACASQLADRQPEAVRDLTASLILSGFSMVLAGSSAPASGGEHLISHFWDMTRLDAGRPTLLHGLQVGVGTLLTAALYQRLANWDPASFEWARREQTYPSWEAEARGIATVYGALTDAVLDEYKNKYVLWSHKRAQLRRVMDLWPQLQSVLISQLPDPDRLRTTLAAAGAPITAAQLGVTPEEVVAAVRWSRCLRARYTVLDLLWDLGLLDQWSEEAAAEAGVV